MIERSDTAERRLFYAAMGAVVRGQRGVLGVSQHELAKKAMITQPTLSRIERGLTVVDIVDERSLARALGMAAGLSEPIEQVIGRCRVILAGAAPLQEYAAVNVVHGHGGLLALAELAVMSLREECSR